MTRRWQIVIGWSLAAVVLVLCSCVFGGNLLIDWIMSPPGPVTVSSWSGGRVTRQGTYTLTTGETLKIWMEPSGVCFKFIAPDGALLFESNVHTSQYQRWALYVDARRCVWLESSDIGPFVWAPDTSGKYPAEGVWCDVTTVGTPPAGFRPK